MSKHINVKGTCVGCGLTAFLGLVIIMSVFPILVQIGRRNGHSEMCLYNEKQLGLALLQYQDDYDSNFPSGRKSERSGVGWAGQLYPYIKSASVFRCPEDTGSAWSPQQEPISYGLNSNVAHTKTRYLTLPAKTITFFETTGSTANFTDPRESGPISHDFSPAGNGLDGQLYCGPANRTAAVKYATGEFQGRQGRLQFTLRGRHDDGGANYGFSDGHARYLLATKVSAGATAAHPSDQQTYGLAARAAGTAVPSYSATFSAR